MIRNLATRNTKNIFYKKYIYYYAQKLISAYKQLDGNYLRRLLALVACSVEYYAENNLREVFFVFRIAGFRIVKPPGYYGVVFTFSYAAQVYHNPRII